jgi:hypothetical protein
MITIYQIRLSDADVVAVNARGWGAVPKADARANMMLGARKWNEDFAKYYEPSYEVDTDDLDVAFEETNLWEDKVPVKVIRRGSSSSVGDIFVKDGACYIVDSFGFTNVGKYELGVN